MMRLRLASNGDDDNSIFENTNRSTDRPHRGSMCGNNPNVAPQVNNAKCIGGTALGFAIVTIVGFLLDWPGAISAILADGPSTASV